MSKFIPLRPSREGFKPLVADKSGYKPLLTESMKRKLMEEGILGEGDDTRAVLGPPEKKYHHWVPNQKNEGSIPVHFGLRPSAGVRADTAPPAPAVCRRNRGSNKTRRC